VLVELSELPACGVVPVSVLRKVPVLAQVRLPVVPLTDIEIGDSAVGRVLQRMRTRVGR
jgi:hypothetical protein